MPRSCHPKSIDIRIENGHMRVSVYGICPKCGTGSGYLLVDPNNLYHHHKNEKDGGTGTCIIVEGCAVSTVCELETCNYAYSVHT